jgi:hypothetical protein
VQKVNVIALPHIMHEHISFNIQKIKIIQINWVSILYAAILFMYVKFYGILGFIFDKNKGKEWREKDSCFIFILFLLLALYKQCTLSSLFLLHFVDWSFKGKKSLCLLCSLKNNSVRIYFRSWIFFDIYSIWNWLSKNVHLPKKVVAENESQKISLSQNSNRSLNGRRWVDKRFFIIIFTHKSVPSWGLEEFGA